MSALISILYLISYVLAFSAVMIFPKRQGQESILAWIPLSFFLLLGFDGLFAGACTLAHIPVSLLSQATGNLALGVSLHLITRKGGVAQSLTITKRDVIVMVVFTIIALAVVRLEFGPDFTPHYIVTDAINHFRRSLLIYFDGTVTGMYQAWNYMANAFGFFSPFIRFDYFYKVYCLCDITFWYFGGLLLYATSYELLKGAHREALSGIFMMLYALGYPLNGMIWGFCYLGVGVSFAVLAVFFCIRIARAAKWGYFAGLAISLYGLITSYALFAPFIFFSAFVCTAAALARQGKASKRQLATVCLTTFALPGILGAWFFYDDILRSGAVTVSSALDNEGGMYRNLYSNLVLFLPLIIVSFWDAFQKRRFLQSPHALTFCVLCASFVVLLVPTYFHAVSTYYLGKLQFAIWPFALLLASVGAERALELPGKILLGAYAAVAAFLGIMVIGNIDQRFANAYQPIGTGTPATYHPYLDVYQWNLNTMRTSGAISADVWNLCHEASDYVDEGKEVPVIAFGMYSGWYFDITCQLDDIRQIRVKPDNPGDSVDQVLDGSFDYVTVITLPYADQGDDGAAAASDILLESGDVEVIYSNGAGYIAQIGG